MGICLGVVLIATIGADIGFTIAENAKQHELNSAISSAQKEIQETSEFYQTVYMVVKTSLDHLKQSLQKLPPDAVEKLEKELYVNIQEPSKLVQDLGRALNIDMIAVSATSLVSNVLTTSGLAAEDGLIAGMGEVAEVAGAALAVVGLGLTVYTGIQQIEELDKAIKKVKDAKSQAEGAMKKMQESLDVIMVSLGLTKGKYETLKEMSNDWTTFAANFDSYSTAFCRAMEGFALGNTEEEVIARLEKDSLPFLNNDVIVLAKLIEENISQMMHERQTDEQIIDYFYTKNPSEGLHFLLNAYFLRTLREMIFSRTK